MGKADVAREARILREPLNTYEAMTFDAGGWVMAGRARLRWQAF